MMNTSLRGGQALIIDLLVVLLKTYSEPHSALRRHGQRRGLKVIEVVFTDSRDHELGSVFDRGHQ